MNAGDPEGSALSRSNSGIHTRLASANYKRREHNLTWKSHWTPACVNKTKQHKIINKNTSLYRTVGTVPKSNTKIVERDKIDTTNTYT